MNLIIWGVFIVVFFILVGCVDCDLFDGAIADFFEGKYKDFWCKHRSKKYILKKVKYIDKLSRDKRVYTSLVEEFIIKSMGSAINGKSFPDVFNKTGTEYLNLTKTRENCISMLKYILGVVEKYPLLEEVKEEVLAELFKFMDLHGSATKNCSFEEFDISFNGFKIISFYSSFSTFWIDVLDNETGEKHHIRYDNYFRSVEAQLLAQIFLRKLSLPEDKKVVEPSPTKVKVNYIRTSTGA